MYKSTPKHLKVCEAKITTATKDEEINDLKRKISSHVEQEARLGAQITSLRERVLELVSLKLGNYFRKIFQNLAYANMNGFFLMA